MKPWMAETVMVALAGLPAKTVAPVGPEAMPKSTPVTLTVVETENEGDVELPVIVITSSPV
jgi:hypothetical protein